MDSRAVDAQPRRTWVSEFVPIQKIVFDFIIVVFQFTHIYIYIYIYIYISVSILVAFQIAHNNIILTSGHTFENPPRRLRNVLFAEDTLLLLRALSQLGVEVEVLNDARKSVKIERVGKKFGNRAARSATASGASTAHPSLHLGNSGTCVRFLSGILGMLSQQDIFLNGTARMKSRPIQPLLDALKPFVPADRLDGELKTFRLAIRGSARVPNKNLTAADKTIKVDGSVSSQFLSGVLMALPLLGGGWRIEVPSGGVSETFVHMTVSVMKEFGASLNCDE